VRDRSANDVAVVDAGGNLVSHVVSIRSDTMKKTSLILAAVLALAVVSPAVAKQGGNGSHGSHGVGAPHGTKDAGSHPNSQVDEERLR
jgi:hypothetical protein